MKSLSRTQATYTGSYITQRRRMRAVIAVTCISSVTLLVIVGVRLGKTGAFEKIAAGHRVTKQKIVLDWENKKWSDVYNGTIVSLATMPLDPFYLSFRGFAAYYKAMELPESEVRGALIDESVASLRKSIATKGVKPEAKVEYILGKAYFDKGYSYFDEAIKYLELSVASGYIGSDSWEYLALAYSRLGDKTGAVRNFESALTRSRADVLLISAAKAYVEAGQHVKAEALLLELLASGNDELAKENGRFVLGEIFKTRGDIQKAEEQYSLILSKDPSSAEAHYQLGLTYQITGDPIRARAEWRKTVSLDPMHAASRQKLSEKLYGKPGG